MIGFNHIGRLGRRGNQMFQYAALRGIAAQNGYNFCFPFYAKGVDDGVGTALSWKDSPRLGVVKSNCENTRVHITQSHNFPFSLFLFLFLTIMVFSPLYTHIPPIPK